MMAAVFPRFRRYCFLNTNFSIICNRRKRWSLGNPFSVSTFQGKREAVNLEYPLTQTEAIFYVENVLQIPNPSERMSESPLQLLGEIQKQTKLLIPFTNVVFIKDKGKPFTLTDSKRLMFQKEGGTCIVINSFTWAVLQQLGYETYLIGGSLPKSRSLLFDAHNGIIVQNLTSDGSFHLVEPGTMHPILEPIPLNFTRVSPVYQLTSYPIRFFKQGPGILKMCMPAPEQNEFRISDDILLENGEKWKCLITYRTLQPLSLSYCFQLAQRIITESNLVPDMHKELAIFGFSGGKLTNIKGQQFVQYRHDGFPEVMKLDLDKTVDIAHQHFPQYSHKYLEQVHQYFTGSENQK